MAEISDAHADAGAVAPGVWRPVAAFVLSLIGFGLSMYLTLEHFQGGVPNCPATGFINCKAVTESSTSEVFGIFPVALLGLIFYTAMVAVNWPPLWRVDNRWLRWARLGGVVGGMGFVLYLLGAELFSIKAICLWCTGVHITTFILFVVVISALPSFSGATGAEAWMDEDFDEGSEEGSGEDDVSEDPELEVR